MKRRMVAVTGLVLAFGAAWCSADRAVEGSSTKPAKAPAFMNSPITLYRDAIGRILTLRIDGRRLVLDREAWNSPEVRAARDKAVGEMKQKLVNAGMPKDVAAQRAAELVGYRGVGRLASDLRKAMNATNSGMRGSSMRGTVRTLANDAMSVTIRSGRAFTFEVRETAAEAPLRMEFSDGDHGLSIFLARLEAEWILHVRQDKETFRVMEVRDGKLRTLAAEDFAALYAKHGDYVRGRLLPVLAHCGISAVTPTDPEVRQAVLEILADPIDAEERQRVMKLLEQLGEGTYKQRQAANEELKENYKRWMGLIRAAAADPKTPMEARARLEAIIEANRGRYRRRELVHALGLAEDASFLRRLLDGLEGEQGARVRERLERLEEGS